MTAAGRAGFAPDSRLVAAVRPSPNHGERRGAGRPDAIVLHYTGMADGPSAIARLCDPAAEVSCHYVVEEDGTVLQMVPEALRAWHAGRGVWAGCDDVNSVSVGIEIVNGGHDFGLPAYPARQVAAVAALCRDVMDRHAVAPARVLAHSDLAPSRKIDPGEHFPWEALARAGVVLWVPPSDDASPVGPGDVTTVQADLARLGYALVPSGIQDAATRLVVAAFQRRYRPARIDGELDLGTCDTLARLLSLQAGLRSAAGATRVTPERP